MAIRRQKRIELRQFDPTWEGSFLLVRTMGSTEVIKSQSDSRKFSRTLEKLEGQLAGETDPDKKKQLEDKMDKEGIKFTNLLRDAIKERLVGGRVYDFDAKEQREVKKEDIDDLDMEVLTYVLQSIQGATEKK